MRWQGLLASHRNTLVELRAEDIANSRLDDRSIRMSKRAPLPKAGACGQPSAVQSSSVRLIFWEHIQKRGTIPVCTLRKSQIMRLQAVYL